MGRLLIVAQPGKGLFYLPSLTIPSDMGFPARLGLLALSLGNFVPAKKWKLLSAVRSIAGLTHSAVAFLAPWV
jgi:hypothetical protein